MKKNKIYKFNLKNQNGKIKSMKIHYQNIN